MRDYVGWRARIGLVYMASSIVMEPEFYAMAPEGVSIHTARIHLPAATEAGLREMMEGGPLEDASTLLGHCPLDSAVFGGTSASFLDGGTYDGTVIARMKARMGGGLPVTTSSTASAAALSALGAKKITFTGPYNADVTARGRRFFEDRGFEVLDAFGLGIESDHGIGDVPLEEVYRFVKKVAVAGSDAVFISCTNFRTVGALAALEEDLGIPVVSSIQASFWHGLRLAGVRDRVTGFGSLFDVTEV
ncbi:hypothetical protein L2U69_11650 [Zavarzinia compransoris]|uniref:maleate cis-trans isomerase family protein n=1 Tax=Zavarzinia marina TaxID=2911065 RepID=UPI001F426DA5|nr:hypothetical protein [Zavarzinia marina]MCF4166300.1 hypothetical protein [Zavarzinia marina]